MDGLIAGGQRGYFTPVALTRQLLTQPQAIDSLPELGKRTSQRLFDLAKLRRKRSEKKEPLTNRTAS